MSSDDKLAAKILSDPPRNDITFKEAESFLLNKGFVRKPSSGGSHITFKHHECSRLVTLPNNSKELKRSYIKNIQFALEEIDSNS